MKKDELFHWAQAFVRPTDPATAHDAASELRLARDRQIIWRLWMELVQSEEWYQTRKVVEFDYLPFLGVDGKQGYRGPRCRSLARRLCDLIYSPRKKYPPPEPLRLLCWTFEKWDKSELLTYTERGRLVLADPGLMTPFWNLPMPKGDKKTKPKKPSVKKPGPWDVELEPPPWSGWEI